MDMSSTEAKITVAKLIELAYAKDKGLTAEIMAEMGNTKLTVDQHGHATLSGSAGIMSYSGSPALDNIGVKVKRVSVQFHNEDGMQIGYTATYSLEIISMTVRGSFDLEALITSCSGLLCKAARALQGRNQAYECELQGIMGK